MDCGGILFELILEKILKFIIIISFLHLAGPINVSVDLKNDFLCL